MCMDGMRRACVRVEIQILSRRRFTLGFERLVGVLVG